MRTARDALEKLVAVDSDPVSAVVALRDAVIRLDSAAAASQSVWTGDVRILWNRREQNPSAIEESA